MARRRAGLFVPSTLALAGGLGVHAVAAAHVPAAPHAFVALHFFAATPPAATPQGIHKIRHVVIIVQENRSFDSYFGTFPRAEGIPMAAGRPAVCAPDPRSGRCVAPCHDHRDLKHDGPHGQAAAAADINGGAMNGFIGQAQKSGKRAASPPTTRSAGFPGKPT
jgi:phospholipase C